MRKLRSSRWWFVGWLCGVGLAFAYPQSYVGPILGLISGLMYMPSADDEP